MIVVLKTKTETVGISERSSEAETVGTAASRESLNITPELRC